MTRRGTALLLGAAVVVALGGRFPPLLGAGIALFAALALASALDGWRAGRGMDVTAVRETEALLSVGRPNTVRIVVEARGKLQATVRDEVPPNVATEHQATALSVPGVLEYSITPSARGLAHFGHTVVRVRGPWGLAFRQLNCGEVTAASVDADLSAIGRYDALARRGQLTESGVRVRRRSMEGTEFERVRDYVPDDPLRSVNWRATARTGRLMTTEYMPERSQPVILCIDHGRLMGVGLEQQTKLDFAISSAALLAHVALQSGDRVGLFAFADRVTATVAPASGRAQLRRILDALRPHAAGNVESDYDVCLARLSRWQRRRALVVIFTDFIDADQGAALARQCLRLSRRHIPLVITVQDPALLAAALAAPTDAATVYRRAAAEGVVNDRDGVLQLLRHSGVDAIDSDARTLSPQLVNRYLEIKRAARL